MFESMVNYTLDKYQPLPLTKAEIKHFISSVIHSHCSEIQFTLC